jgi:hypothetical protein
MRRVYTVTLWLESMDSDQWDESLCNLTSRAPTNSSGIDMRGMYE